MSKTLIAGRGLNSILMRLCTSLCMSLWVGTSLNATTSQAGPLTNMSEVVAIAVFGPTLLGAAAGLGATAVAGAATVGAAAGTSALTTAELETRKVIALALEDAAYFYDSGNLSGILPSTLARMRELRPELAQASDTELVDAIVETVSQL